MEEIKFIREGKEYSIKCKLTDKTFIVFPNESRIGLNRGKRVMLFSEFAHEVRNENQMEECP